MYALQWLRTELQGRAWDHWQRLAITITGDKSREQQGALPRVESCRTVTAAAVDSTQQRWGGCGISKSSLHLSDSELD